MRGALSSLHGRINWAERFMGFGIALLAREDWTHDIEVSSLLSPLLLMTAFCGFSRIIVGPTTDIVGMNSLAGLHGFAALTTTVIFIYTMERRLRLLSRKRLKYLDIGLQFYFVKSHFLSGMLL